MKALLALCLLLATAVPAFAQSDVTQSDFVRDALAAHNALRSQVRVPPLSWDGDLAAEAAHWAMQLARSSFVVHSAGSARSGAGENLWIGTAGAFSVAEAIGRWGAERANYVGGVFPNVSRLGPMETVAHYTQIVWRQTRRVGCGSARWGPWDVLVCRYGEPGNVMGQTAF